MPIVTEVAEALKLVAEGIGHIKTVSDAIRDGRQYLKKRHPEIRDDLVAMCAELQKTALAIATASALLTHFRFTVAGSALDTEPARFNEHLVAHKAKAAQVDASLRAMRGHCRKIEEHVQALERRQTQLGLASVLQLLGIDARERDAQLLRSLKFIHDEEVQGYQLVNRLGFALQRSLEAVENTLGPPAAMFPREVPAAAAVLAEHAEPFARLEAESNYVALELQQSIDDLLRQVG